MQANAIDRMLRGSPLRDAPRIVVVLAVTLLACVPAMAALRRSARFTIATIVALAIGFLAAAQIAFQAGLIVALIVPLGR